MNDKHKFWLVGTLLTILTLPAYVAGILWRLYTNDFRSGMLAAKRFERWLQKTYDKLNPKYDE